MILALDTSTSLGSVALYESGAVLMERTFSGTQRHSTTLFPALAALDLPGRAIEKIMVGLGPGSFSGIRVSLAAAQAVAAVKGAVLVGIASTWSLARQFSEEERLGVFADARRGEIYVTTYCRGQLEKATYLIPAAQIVSESAAMSRAVSAEPLAGISERASPRATDYFTFPETFSEWVYGPHLEPIYLREAVKSA
jgi:tRNA threonylcarbamoyladenosine biosynthesis protein TsaB